MNKVVIRKTKKDKLWIGMRITNGKREGVFTFLNDKKEIVYRGIFAPLSGFVPFSDDPESRGMPFFNTPIRIKGLVVKKPKDSDVVVFWSKEDEENMFITRV